MSSAAQLEDRGGVEAASADASPEPALDVGELFAEHAPFIMRVLIRLVGDGPHIDDLVQETFLIAFRRRASFEGRSAPRTWLYGIASRIAMRHRRGSGRLRRFLGQLTGEPASDGPVRPDENLEKERAVSLMREVLDTMPFKQREAFVLYEIEELACAEIADLLAIPVGTVWTRLHHARKKFQERMLVRLEGDRR